MLNILDIKQKDILDCFIASDLKTKKAIKKIFDLFDSSIKIWNVEVNINQYIKFSRQPFAILISFRCDQCVIFFEYSPYVDNNERIYRHSRLQHIIYDDDRIVYNKLSSISKIKTLL